MGKKSALKPRYDWVFFDYGGTLTADTEITIEHQRVHANKYGQALLEWFNAIGCKLPYDAEQMQQFTIEAGRQNTDREGFQLSIRKYIDYYVEWMRCVYRCAGITRYAPVVELESAFLFMLWRMQRNSVPAAGKGTNETLGYLSKHGIRIGCISNNSGYVKDTLFLNGILDYFEVVIDSARVGICKPDPGIFDLAVEQADAKGKSLLYVGDSYEADVIGGTRAGWDVAWISGEERELPAGNVYRIQALTELKKICFGRRRRKA